MEKRLSIKLITGALACIICAYALILGGLYESNLNLRHNHLGVIGTEFAHGNFKDIS